MPASDDRRRHVSRGRAAAAAIAAALAAAAVPAVAEPPGQDKKSPAADKTAPEVSVSFSSAQLESRLLAENASFGVSCDERCTIKASLAAGARTFDKGTLIGQADSRLNEAGKRLVKIPISTKGRQMIARRGNLLLVLRVQVTDDAGNRASVGDRLSRTQRLTERIAG